MQLFRKFQVIFVQNNFVPSNPLGLNLHLRLLCLLTNNKLDRA